MLEGGAGIAPRPPALPSTSVRAAGGLQSLCPGVGEWLSTGRKQTTEKKLIVKESKRKADRQRWRSRNASIAVLTAAGCVSGDKCPAPSISRNACDGSRSRSRSTTVRAAAVVF